jgi:lysophospholipase L1-like esterase
VTRHSPIAALTVVALCSCRGPELDEAGEVASSTSSAELGSSDSGSETSEPSETESGDESGTETDDEPEPTPAWVTTWGTALAADNPFSAPVFAIEGQSLRQVAQISLGGGEFRVRLANSFGDTELPVSEARLARSAGGSAIEPGSDRQLTVDGSPSFVIPVGEIVVTDPVELELPARSDLSVSLYLSEPVLTTTVHAEAHQTSWLSAGNLSAQSDWPAAQTETRTSYYWLNAIEVIAPEAAAIVTLGDSITDGAGSTLDANRRWPDRLAERLQAHAATSQVAVVNAGIGGNCLLREFIGERALDRFERDVLDQPGVAWVIILVGINDIGIGSSLGQPVTAEPLIAGYLELIEEAHARGLRVYGATLLPYEGANYFNESDEQVRQAVNDWIRSSGSFDAVIDFDAVTRDPEAPTRLLPAYDSGDHLHPSDAGYLAMGDAIELALFE